MGIPIQNSSMALLLVMASSSQDGWTYEGQFVNGMEAKGITTKLTSYTKGTFKRSFKCALNGFTSRVTGLLLLLYHFFQGLSGVSLGRYFLHLRLWCSALDCLAWQGIVLAFLKTFIGLYRHFVFMVLIVMPLPLWSQRDYMAGIGLRCGDLGFVT